MKTTQKDPEWLRGMVAWVCWHRQRNRDREALLAWAAEHRPDLDPERIRQAWPVAIASCRNVLLVGGAGDDERLCDIKGIDLRGSPM